MKRTGRMSALVVVLCLILIAGLAALGWFSPGLQGAVGPVALLATAPLIAAAFLSPLLTLLVGVIALAAGACVALLPPGHQLADYSLALGGVAAAVVAGVLVSALRGRGFTEAHESAPAVVEAVVLEEEPEQYPVVELRAPSSDIDAMTGLLNRLGAIRVLGHRNAEGERVVAFLDCDLFRHVNETYGTGVGDEFLQAIAGRLRHSLPVHDTVARWDGDEFLVAVSADAASAMSALERVVGAIKGHPIRTAAGPIETSMSVGAAVWLTGQDLEDVIARAGGALHSAKSSGRGQVVLDPGTGSAPA